MDNNLYSFALVVFTGFFAIMNPIANAPVFLGLTGGLDKHSRNKVARKATITSFFIVFAFILFGKLIFHLFGITIPAFKVTGGILVFLVGIDMLRSHQSNIHGHNMTPAPEDDIAISPLAIPILAGPGTIVTAMNYASNTTILRMFLVVGIFAVMIILTYLAFVLSDKIMNWLGKSMVIVISKIMGLIIAIIGTGMVVDGIKLAFGLAQ